MFSRVKREKYTINANAGSTISKELAYLAIPAIVCLVYDLQRRVTMDLICNKYRRLGKLGSGTFCNVFLAEDIENGAELAVKMDKLPAECTRSVLLHEYKVYAKLADCNGVPRIHHYGQHRGYNVLVMDKLGLSLENLFNLCGRRFSLKTVLMLVYQMIRLVESLHVHNIIHRDIKPDNLVMGIGLQANLLFIIDFGLSKKYYSPSTRSHIPYREGKSLVGTARYASINAHTGVELSRRDDMESIGYMMIYFQLGSLPWQGMQGSNKLQRYERILEKKLSTPIEVLCAGCPIQFAVYLQYCRDMSFDGEPDYQYWIVQFRNLMHSLQLQYDLVYDWSGITPPQESENDDNNNSSTTENKNRE